MTTGAVDYLRTIESWYQAAGRPDHNTWYFDAGRTTDVHLELLSLGLLSKVLGTERGYAWRLSEAGLAQLPRTA